LFKGFLSKMEDNTMEEENEEKVEEEAEEKVEDSAGEDKASNDEEEGE